MTAMKTLFPRLPTPAFLAALIITLGPALPFLARAAAPSWWQQRGVLDAAQPQNDYAAVNIGQLKHIAKQAMLELDAKLPGGAGTAIQQMVASWSTVPPDRNDFAAVNVGQLKAVAKPFYDRLNEAGYILPAPWSNDIQEKNDFAVTNVGQLKMVFSFCIDCTPTLDTDSDGLPDWWEMQHFPLNSPSFNKSGPDDDPDNDLLTNAEEYKNGTNPKSGADGLKIQLEVYDRSGFAYSSGFRNWAGGDTLFRNRKTTYNFSAFYEGGTQYNESFSWSIDENHTHPIVTGALVEMLDQPAYSLMNMITETTTGDTSRTPSFPFAYLFQKTLETFDEQPTYTTATTFYDPQSPTAMGSAQSVNKEEYLSPINDAEMFTALNGDLSPTSPPLQIINTNTYGSFAQRQISSSYAINANVCSYRYALRSKNGANLQLDSPKSIMWIESHEATLNDLYGGRHYSELKRATLNLGEETPLHQLDARQFLPSGQPGRQTAYHSVNLLPVELYSDLNNDGSLTSADSGLTGSPYASGATDEQKDKGTEFIFKNDDMSNGAWDKYSDEGSNTVGQSSANDTDDDAEELVIKPGITEGEVWLDHPAIAGLSFYKSKKCLDSEKVNISPSQHFALSSSNPLPQPLFMRVDGSISFSTTDPQKEGDLKLMIKPTGGAAAGIEAGKMKLTVIEKLGATKYHRASADYIRENNTTHFVRNIDLPARFFGTTPVTVTSMLEENTEMKGINAALHTLKGISAVMTSANWKDMTAIINGTYFNGNTFDSNRFIEKHQGELYASGTWDTSCSVSITSINPGHGNYYLAYGGTGFFHHAAGDVPTTARDGTGGLYLAGATVGDDPFTSITRIELGTASPEKIIVLGACWPGILTGTMAQYGPHDAYTKAVRKGATKEAVLLCDGGATVGMSVANPDGSAHDARQKAARHVGGLYPKVYLGFKAKKPRP